ncbi:FAD-dependent oxidoreductase [Thiomonas sp.]|uniref:FAD-dependent oxidoreductase n=1 Tax=Thiomonas sp. TaxID=2047785 RepID=UPI0026353FF4|nr:FAD-dependent oxidoreductase [Thiomonas sp.]
MTASYVYPKYPFRLPHGVVPGSGERRVPLVVVGAGPIGLAAAIDAAQRGQEVVLLDDDDTVSVGSRGLCYAKRTIEILDRLGVGDPVVAKGVTWNTGRVFHRDDEVYHFDLLDAPGHQRPGMVNLQQYYLEEFLVDRAAALPQVTLCWKNRVVAAHADAEGATLDVETPSGNYRLRADWLIVADGARSPVRKMLGLDAAGRVFNDRFLIADVAMHADFPAERWFWFDPPFHRGQSVLLHRQADDIWRIDFQLGWNADPEAEKRPERVIPRIRAMLDHQGYRNVDFSLEWVSVYTFQCRRMSHFRHGRVLFAGDAAHQVSPFGARGANSGIQDVDNLIWKLDLVMRGKAPVVLLDSYDVERTAAADENILNSTRSTDFITPKSPTALRYRDATLQLAAHHAFARALVNSGRLSTPTHYWGSALCSPDRDHFDCLLRPGSPLDDAPVERDGEPGWLLRQLADGFTLMLFTDRPESLGAVLAEFAPLGSDAVPVRCLVISEQPGTLDGVVVLHDVQHFAAERYDAQEGTAYLIRPDQHIAARWRKPDISSVRAAVARACGH